MTMSVSAVAPAAPQAAGHALSREGVAVSFRPDAAGGAAPLESIGADLARRLEAFDRTRQTAQAAQNGRALEGGPAALREARAELSPGPASLRLGGPDAAAAAQAESPTSFDQVYGAMRKSFDYAIETQLVVKTGSQFASSLNSLMRGQ